MCRRRAIETGLQRERPKERRTESKIRALRERGRQRTGGETGSGKKNTRNSESPRGSWDPEEQEGDTEPGAKRRERRREINNRAMRQEAEKIHTYEPARNRERGKDREPRDPQFSKSCGTCT